MERGDAHSVKRVWHVVYIHLHKEGLPTVFRGDFLKYWRHLLTRLAPTRREIRDN